MDKSHIVRLPIGLEVDGTVYQEFHIDKMTGVDQKNMASSKHRNNGARAMTQFLQRVVQKIPGLMESKDGGQFGLAPEKYFRSMYSPDRDLLFLQCNAMSMNDEFEISAKCPRCGRLHDVTVELDEIEVYEMDDEDPEASTTFLVEGLTDGISMMIPSGDGRNERKVFKTVEVELLTGRDQEAMHSVREADQQNFMIHAFIKSVPGAEGIKPSRKHIARMTVEDQQLILEEIAERTPGADLRQEVVCENNECQHEWLADIDLANFFSARGRTKKKRSLRSKRGVKKRRRR